MKYLVILAMVLCFALPAYAEGPLDPQNAVGGLAKTWEIDGQKLALGIFEVAGLGKSLALSKEMPDGMWHFVNVKDITDHELWRTDPRSLLETFVKGCNAKLAEMFPDQDTPDIEKETWRLVGEWALANMDIVDKRLVFKE